MHVAAQGSGDGDMYKLKEELVEEVSSVSRGLFSKTHLFPNVRTPPKTKSNHRPKPTIHNYLLQASLM